MKVQTNKNTNTKETDYLVSVPEEIFAAKLPIAIFEEVTKLVAHKIAEKVLREKGQEIFKQISQKAVATLAVAEAGRGIKEILDKKLPDKVETIVKKETEVWQRGILGGIRRIR